MNSGKRSFQLVAQLCARQLSTSQARSSGGDVAQGYSKIKAKQARFQVDDGQLIFLKGGILDKVMYQTTMALSVVGVALVLKLIFDLSVPKKN